MKVCLLQRRPEKEANNGVDRIVQEQYDRLSLPLPEYGIEFVDNPDTADVVASHIDATRRDIDVLHLHGVYWSDLPHVKYNRWHHVVNMRIADSLRRARFVTVPAPWVGAFLQRDMRIDPIVIPHGVDTSVFSPGEPGDYVLWNKSRADDVCDPTPIGRLLEAGCNVVTTFAPQGYERHPNVYVTGWIDFEAMRQIVRHCMIYLATTCETFGIGTLEAMSAGKPVVGYAWGGTADLLRDGGGVLVDPEDEEALVKACAYAKKNERRLGREARAIAENYTWSAAMEQYAALYRHAAEHRARERHRVCVVVTNYNYGRYLPDAVRSVYDQTEPADEIIVIDDGSTDDDTDNAIARCHSFASKTLTVVRQDNQGVAAARNNGIVMTACEYVVCLDADDMLAPEYIAHCKKALRESRSIGIAYTGLGLLQEDGSVQPSSFPPEFDWNRQAEPGSPPSTCVPTAAMFRRELWQRSGGYKQSFAPAEDAEFYTRMLSIGATAVKTTDAPLIHYRNHADGASKRLEYRDISFAYPWMHDRKYPFASPNQEKEPFAPSYHLPVVSVVIPVGTGHTNYVPAALDSLLAQDFRQWEVIVVDDTLEKNVRERLSAYPFAIVHEVALNGRATMGPGHARNEGAKLARGTLLFWLDADDWLAVPHALRLLVTKYVETGAYVYSDWVGYDGRNFTEGIANEYSAEAWLSKGQHAVSALVPVEAHHAVGGFDEDIRGWEDWDYFAKFALHGHCGVRQPGFLLGYRTTSGQRRDYSLLHRDELLPVIQDRYEGKTPMGCNCGSVAKTLTRLRQGETILGSTQSTTAVGAGQTLMEYTGSNIGRQSVNSRTQRNDNGKPVRYSFGGADRFLAVYDEDVAFMESLGKFRRVGAAAVEAKPEPVASAVVRDAPAFRVEAPVETPVEAEEVAEPEAEEIADDVADLSDFDFSAIQKKAEADAKQRREAATQSMKNRSTRTRRKQGE
jgi:glycosyltransferase involved in cell wall biosynthesis